MNAKVVVLVVLLIALLFAAFVVRGDRRGQRSLPNIGEIDPNDFPALKRFDAMFGPKRTTVDSARLGDQCGLASRAFVVPANASCSVIIAPRSDDVAFLVLRLAHGVGASIGFEPSDPPADAESPKPKSLQTGETLRVPVQADGGLLSMACRGMAACTVALVD